MTKQRLIVAGAALVVLAAVLITWLAWPDGSDKAPPRERAYKSTTACLLTDDKGVNADPAKAVWSGMQEASVKTLIKVQYLAVAGAQTPDNALSYYNTLAVQQCTVIIAAGPVPVAAMVNGYGKFPKIKQVAVGGDTKGASVTKVDPGSAAADDKRIVADAA